MSNADKLKLSWGRDTPVKRLVLALERECEKHGVSASRWESNRGSKTHIVWAVHFGPRPARFSLLAPGVLIAKANLYTREGRTEQSEAYQKLLPIYRYMQRYKPKMMGVDKPLEVG